MSNAARRAIENATIVAGICSFWPWIFGYRGMLYHLGLIVIVIMLAVLAVVRFLRVKRAFDHPKQPIAGNWNSKPGAGN